MITVLGSNYVVEQLSSSLFFKWARPTSIYGFSRCACVRACVRTCVRAYVRVRKLVEAELTMTIKVKVVSLDE